MFETEDCEYHWVLLSNELSTCLQCCLLGICRW